MDQVADEAARRLQRDTYPCNGAIAKSRSA
jgi:hypothetical protein